MLAHSSMRVSKAHVPGRPVASGGQDRPQRTRHRLDRQLQGLLYVRLRFPSTRPIRQGSVTWHASRPTMSPRSEEHTSELQSLMRNSYAVFCLTKKKRATIMTAHTYKTQRTK